MNPSDLIDRLGGTAATARLAGVKPPSVSEWRRSGIPATRAIQIDRATAQLDRQMMTEQQLAAAAKKKARQAKTLRLD